MISKTVLEITCIFCKQHEFALSILTHTGEKSAISIIISKIIAY